jgi:mannose-6-phosphate isomerase-like protein (cupin superfamily)
MCELNGYQRDNSASGVKDSEWRERLALVETDATVGIRHAAISGSADYRTHVAAIPVQVGCHYHAEGDEKYAVVEGQGILYFGKIENGQVRPESWRSIAVSMGDSFIIPEGYAHQLRKTGEGDLTIVFGCPDSHLENDRFMLEDAPNEVGGLSADSTSK